MTTSSPLPVVAAPGGLPAPSAAAVNDMAFLDGCRRAYPTVSVSASDAGAIQGRIRWRMVEHFPIAHVRTANAIVESCAGAAAEQGMAEHYKLVWQLGGSAFFENARGHTDIQAGQAMIVPFSSAYRLHARGHYNALTAVFGADRLPRWKGLADELCGQPLRVDAAFNATAASIGSLLRKDTHMASASLVVEYAIDLMFRSLLEQRACTPLAPARGGNRLERARELVQQNLDDHGYSPAQIADALGMSRRSLYEAFRQYGTTPAGFIRQIRLEHARRDVLRNGADAPSLTEVALRNGFNDSASFSRAFREAFGVAPSVLRAAH